MDLASFTQGITSCQPYLLIFNQTEPPRQVDCLVTPSDCHKKTDDIPFSALPKGIANEFANLFSTLSLFC